MTNKEEQISQAVTNNYGIYFKVGDFVKIKNSSIQQRVVVDKIFKKGYFSYTTNRGSTATCAIDNVIENLEKAPISENKLLMLEKKLAELQEIINQIKANG